LVAGLLFVVADERVTGTAFWNGRREEFLASLFLVGAYLVTALISIIAAARGKPLKPATVVATSLSVFGLAFFLLLVVARPPPY